VNDSTGFTPAYLNGGRELRTPFDNWLDVNLSKVSEIRKLGERLNLIHAIARENLEASQLKYLENANQKTKQRSFKEGDKVWYRSHYLSDASKGITAKLMNKREGPYIVMTKISDAIYDLKHEGMEVVAVKGVHINDLSAFIPRSQ
jgi:hypothetical protein